MDARCSRYIVHWEIRESMTGAAMSRQSCSGRWNGIQEKSHGSSVTMACSSAVRDFKEFIRLTGVTHVRTSLHYPQSNGKIERWHGSLKRECVRPAAALFVR